LLLGITDIITVQAPMYEVSFSDYERSDSCYKLPTVNSNEYFLISAYENSDYSYWTEQWPMPDSGGIMITHIKTNFYNQNEYYRKRTDIEAAHGLWNVNWTIPPQFTTENADSGRDSMDFAGVYRTHPPWHNIGNETCLYDGSSYTVFDGLSNPNSNLYSIGGRYPQTIISHVGVRNIQNQGNGVFLADFLVNNWYDTLDGNTTWGSPTQDMGYAITGDIVVKVSDTLTIEKGTTIYFQELEDNQAGGADADRCELIVYGTLIAQGTASDSILFVPSSEQLGSPAKGDWYGIRLMPGSEGIMEYCAVRYAEFGVYMDSSSEATLSSCLISQNDHTGIYVKEADLDLDSSAVTYNDYGVYIIDDGIARIDDSELSDNAATGVWNRPGTLVMRDCTIEDNGVVGIRGMGSIDSVYTTTISGQKYGIHWVGEDEAVFDSCVITCTGSTGSYYGIYARKEGTANPDVYVRNDSIANFPQGGIYFNQISSDGLIRNTDVVSCETYGVYYYNTSASITCVDTTKRNQFYDNTYGLYLYSSSSPTVRRTRFKNNSSHGVKIGSGCSPDFGVAADSGFNSFVQTGLTPQNYYDLDNGLNHTPVNAIGNWWEEDPPNEDEIVNAVYDPYLTSDPLPAKLVPGLEIEGLPQDFSVAKVYPNPFNPTTAIKFSLSSPQRVTVRIYNILGQEVKLLTDGPMPAGQNTVVWDGRNAKGEYVSSGIYLCQMRTMERQKTLKMTLLR
jgi:parallel beta-helix repeat protein